MNIQESKAIITVSNSLSHHCPFDCEGAQTRSFNEFQDVVNHLISVHGCALLHVGNETTEGPNSKPWQSTIAVLGSPEELPQLAPSEFFETTPPPRGA